MDNRQTRPAANSERLRSGHGLEGKLKYLDSGDKARRTAAPTARECPLCAALRGPIAAVHSGVRHILGIGPPVKRGYDQ
jgi:hypothetical protein